MCEIHNNRSVCCDKCLFTAQACTAAALEQYASRLDEVYELLTEEQKKAFMKIEERYPITGLQIRSIARLDMDSMFAQARPKQHWDLTKDSVIALLKELKRLRTENVSAYLGAVDDGFFVYTCASVPDGVPTWTD
jgi:hypothetical protein